MSGKPIILAYHIMWTAYGWWLPNDPRGSTSRTIRNDLVAELGEVHFGRKQVQPAGKDIRAFYGQAAATLKHELLQFAPDQFPLVARALGETIRDHKYTCYGCAVMPDHVHVLIRRHRDQAEDMLANLQSESCSRVSAFGLRAGGHPAWTRGGWKVFLDHPDDIRRTIRYIEDNPLKMGLGGQDWDFVEGYDGWPLHEGHSVNSPYVKALKRAGRYLR
jgi:REP-associated tyrosine transposase